MANRPREFELDDGIYRFDRVAFKDIYKRYPQRGKMKLLEQISYEVNKEFDTVKDWTKGNSGPSDYEAVEVLAKYFGCDPKDLLIKVKDKENNMNTIQESEKTVARHLYGEMLEMMQFIKWNCFDPDVPSVKIRTENYERFHNQEEAREHYLLEVRKTALDLPAEMRLDLLEIVDECFGEEDVDYNEMFINSKSYREYIFENELKDTDESRCKYAAIFKQKTMKAIDEVFKDYIRV